MQAATFPVSDCATLAAADVQMIVPCLNHYGFAVVTYSRDDDPRSQIRSLASIFGPIHRHKRSESDGVAPISASGHFPGYYGTSHHAHPPHTDGAFDNRPPMFMALQCLVKAEQGGDSQLLSGAGLYDSVANHSPAALRALFAPDALTVRRDGEGAMASIFTVVADAIHLRYRDDTTAEFADRADVALGVDLCRRHVADPRNILQFRLEPQQILIVDNRGVLHGRTSFNPTSGRLLLRATYTGEGTEQLGLRCGFSR